MNKPGINSKLYAFTLFEVMVSLSLTSLVIIVTILAYSIIKKQFVNYQEQSEQINSYYQLMNTLENDLRKYTVQKIDTISISLTNYKNCISYTFDEGYIIRAINDEQDTLTKNDKIYKLLFNNSNAGYSTSDLINILEGLKN